MAKQNPSFPDNSGYAGSRDHADSASKFNAISFLARQILSRANTATLVRVLSVTNNGGVSPVGYVDVLPLVNQVDGLGNATPHATIFNVPYMRLQGGTNAVIMDPQVGDIGAAVFADHDISAVKATKAQANPGSGRRFDMADGMYLGGLLNGTPSQYVQFNSDGIIIVSPAKVTITAPNIAINGNVAITGTVTDNGVNISSTHVHPDPQGGTTGTPE